MAAKKPDRKSAEAVAALVAARMYLEIGVTLKDAILDLSVIGDDMRITLGEISTRLEKLTEQALGIIKANHLEYLIDDL